MIKKLLLLCSFLLYTCCCAAQSLLERVVSVDMEHQSAAYLLAQLGREGHVLFSYNSDILADYNNLNLHVQQKTIKQVLDQAFEGTLHYKERGKYIILLEGGERSFVISGYIQNGRTGEKISNVTVYESQLLASALTNEKGYFRLPLKNKERTKVISLTVRKEAYTELSLNLNAGYDQELVLPIVPASEVMLEDVVIHQQKVESTWISRFFLSSKQQIQAMNLKGFMASRPIQTSLIPGIGTHGILGAQVINKFSLNMLGGYTAGVNGVEIGGLFNINKGNVRAVQIAGLFNNVGGKMTGVQVGGIYNNVIGTAQGIQVGGLINRVHETVTGIQISGMTNALAANMRGVQVAGINNHVKTSTEGTQVAGVLNRSGGTMNGIQVAGVANINRADSRGIMLAGLWNSTRKTMTGTQISGLVNVAGNIKGIQIGLINIADTLDGYCIGLFNYSRNGRHNLLIGANEIQDITIGYRSGTSNLYSLLVLGTNSDQNNKSYSVSYGVGTTLMKYRSLALDAALLVQSYYLGDWGKVASAGRLQLMLSYQPLPWFSIYGGPSYMAAPDEDPVQESGYMSGITGRGEHTQRLGDQASGWLGWQFGLSFF